MFLSELVEWLFKFCFFICKSECLVLCVTKEECRVPTQPASHPITALTSALVL